MGAGSAAADDRVWLRRAWLRQAQSRPGGFATILAAIGVPQPHVMAWITCMFEFVGGICVMAGAFVLPLSVPLAMIMLTAMLSVHLRYGFSSIRLKAVTPAGAEFGPIGYEMNLLYIAGLTTLALSGAGRLSIDRYLQTRLRGGASTSS